MIDYRIEKLLLKTKAGKMKIAGTIICLVGALITILYKGKSFHIGHVHMLENSIIKKRTHWARGTVMLLSSCLSLAIWYIVQVYINPSNVVVSQVRFFSCMYLYSNRLSYSKYFH